MTSAEARGPLYSLLGAHADERLAGKSAAGALAEALPDIKRYVDSLDPNTMGTVLHARGLDRAGLDLRTAQTMRRMSPQEVDEVAAGFRADVNPMDLPPELAKDWQDFSTAVSEAGAEIENHFAANLVQLEPGLASLATSTADLIDHMLKDGGPVEGWLKRIDGGLGGFAAKIGSDESMAAIGKFVKTVADIGGVIAQIGAKAGSGGSGPAANIWGQTPSNDGGGDDWRMSPDARRKGNYWLNRIFGIGGGDTGSRAASPRGGALPPVGVEPADQSVWGPNTGGAQPGVMPGRNPDLTHVDPRLLEVFGAGARHLPPGYKVMITEGYNPSGHVPGSMHHAAGVGAIDFVIVTPDGRRLQNAGGNDPTGLYRMIHRHMEGELAARYPELARRRVMGHGPDFGTGRGSNRRDWMHIDFGGSRGDGLIEGLGPVEGEHYGKAEAPPAKTAPVAAPTSTPAVAPVASRSPATVGATSTVHVDDETGHAEVRTDTRTVGPLASYDSGFGRFGH